MNVRTCLSLFVENTERVRHPSWKIALRKFRGRGISTFIDYSVVVIQVSYESIDTSSTVLFVDKKIPHAAGDWRFKTAPSLRQLYKV